MRYSSARFPIVSHFEKVDNLMYINSQSVENTWLRGLGACFEQVAGITQCSNPEHW